MADNVVHSVHFIFVTIDNDIKGILKLIEQLGKVKLSKSKFSQIGIRFYVSRIHACGAAG